MSELRVERRWTYSSASRRSACLPGLSSNFLGVERTVRSVADIHLAYMPYSHSVATALGAALVAWLVLE